MKKSLIALAIMTLSAGAFACSGGSCTPTYNNAAGNSGSATQVNSQSAANASSSGTGTAWSSTQSGSFATAGQVTSGPVVNGVASVAGFTTTSEYLTSSSATTGTACAASQSWNSATADATSFAPVNTPGVGSGVASGSSLSASSGSVSSSSLNNQHSGVTQIQGNTASNVGGYTATDSAVISSGSVQVGSVWVPVTNVSTQTSAYAFNNSAQSNTTMYGDTSAANVGNGAHTVANSGSSSAVAN